MLRRNLASSIVIYLDTTGRTKLYNASSHPIFNLHFHLLGLEVPVFPIIKPGETVELSTNTLRGLVINSYEEVFNDKESFYGRSIVVFNDYRGKLWLRSFEGRDKVWSTNVLNRIFVKAVRTYFNQN